MFLSTASKCRVTEIGPVSQADQCLCEKCAWFLGQDNGVITHYWNNAEMKDFQA